MWKMRLKAVFIVGCWDMLGHSHMVWGFFSYPKWWFGPNGAPIWWSGWWKILLGNSWVEELGKWWKWSWDTIEIFGKWTWSLTFGLWKIGDGKFFLDPSGDVRWSLVQGELSCQDVARWWKIMEIPGDFWPNFEINRVPCLFVFIWGLFAQISPIWISWFLFFSLGNLRKSKNGASTVAPAPFPVLRSCTPWRLPWRRSKSSGRKAHGLKPQRTYGYHHRPYLNAQNLEDFL